MFERFDAAARLVVTRARDESELLGHDRIGTEHLLLGLARDESAAGRALTMTGFDPERGRTDARRYVRGREALLGEADAEALRAIGIDLDEIRRRTEETFGPGALHPLDGPKRGGTVRGGLGCDRPFTPRAKRCLELALRSAVARRQAAIGPEDILLGILSEGRGTAIGLLRRQEVDPAELRTLVRESAADQGGGLDSRGA